MARHRVCSGTAFVYHVHYSFIWIFCILHVDGTIFAYLIKMLTICSPPIQVGFLRAMFLTTYNRQLPITRNNEQYGVQRQKTQNWRYRKWMTVCDRKRRSGKWKRWEMTMYNNAINRVKPAEKCTKRDWVRSLIQNYTTSFKVSSKNTT